MNDFIAITDKNIEYSLIHLKQLVFEVTDACNLRCKYCGYAGLYEGYDKRENLMFSWKRAKMILDYLYGIWQRNCDPSISEGIAISFYGGEPLLNVPFIKQVIAYLENLPIVGKKYHYTITTNAVLLDRYMDFLVEKEFRLLISLDGDKIGHGYRVDVYGHNSFDCVFQNIQLLRSKYPDYFEHWVGFNTVIHNRNSVEVAYKFIKDNFNKEPTLSPLNNSGIREDKKEEFLKTYRDVSASIENAGDSEGLKKNLFIKNPETTALLNYIHENSGNVFSNYNELFRDKSQLNVHPTGTCIPFDKKMFITVKGRILQCEKINHEFAIGQITDNGIELNLLEVAKQHNYYVFKLLKQCTECALRGSCSQCVFQLDDINKDKVVCRGFCSKEQLEQRNKRIMEYLDLHPELYKRLLKEVVLK